MDVKIKLLKALATTNTSPFLKKKTMFKSRGIISDLDYKTTLTRVGRGEGP